MYSIIYQHKTIQKLYVKQLMWQTYTFRFAKCMIWGVEVNLYSHLFGLNNLFSLVHHKKPQ